MLQFLQMLSVLLSHAQLEPFLAVHFIPFIHSVAPRKLIFSSLLQIFMHKSAMQMHVSRELSGRSEVKPHQCQQCLKSFSSNHQLVQHIRVHTGEKPYKCSYCDRRFKQLSHVQQHTRLHTGKLMTVFQCSFDGTMSLLEDALL